MNRSPFDGHDDLSFSDSGASSRLVVHSPASSSPSSLRLPGAYADVQAQVANEASHDEGQPLIVPPREAPLIATGHYSYVEVIGSVVLFVQCTLSELNIRDGGCCILDRCTITDALGDERIATRAAITCGSSCSVECRQCMITSANIGISCAGVARLLWSTVTSRCGIWISAEGAALVSKCSFTSAGKDVVCEGGVGLVYQRDEGETSVRLMAQEPGAIRTFPSTMHYDTNGPCYSRGTRRVVPDDFPTLQRALDASVAGDTVELLCFCRGPIVIPNGVRLVGGSIESTGSASRAPCIVVKPFGLLEQCDVRVDAGCTVAVQAMPGALVTNCYVRNERGIGVVCERGASICDSVVVGRIGIMMEESSLWCFRNVVRKCRETGIVATKCLVEGNTIVDCGSIGISATSCHVFNNGGSSPAKQSAWCINSAWGLNKLQQPSLVNCIESEARINEDRKSAVASAILASGDALMKKHDYSFGLLPVSSSIPPPLPDLDTSIIHADFDFLHKCLEDRKGHLATPAESADSSSGGEEPQRRITVECFESLLDGSESRPTKHTRKREKRRKHTRKRNDKDTESLNNQNLGGEIPRTRKSKLGGRYSDSLPEGGELSNLSASSNVDAQTSAAQDESVEQDDNLQQDQPSFHLRRLRWALCSLRPLQDPDMFLLPVAMQAKQWSNGHKGVEQSFLDPPSTCHFVNVPLNSVECGFILLEAIKQGKVDKQLLATALGREQHSRLRITFTKMWASKFVKREWRNIERAMEERRPRGLGRDIRELFGIQRAAKGKVAATFFISSMRSFFSKTLRMAGVEADSVLRLVEDYGRALANIADFTKHLEQCILPPEERTQYKEVEDIIFALAYAVIMLNTSLHNKSTKAAMSKQSFITFGEQTHCAKEILRYVYKMIKDEAL